MTSASLVARRALALSAPLCVGALLAACASSGGSASPSGTVTQPPSTVPASTAPASSTPVPVPSSSAPAGPQPCATRSLQAKLGLSQGTAGHIYQVIDFTNISTVTCTLYGYPGVALAGGTPVSIIGQPADENPATPRETVTLAPGAVANALLSITEAGNVPASRCDQVPATYLQVIPPNQTTPIFVAYTATACSKPYHLLVVDVVKPGSGG